MMSGSPRHAPKRSLTNLMGTPLKDCTIYVPWFPCTDCARGIIQVGKLKKRLNKVSEKVLGEDVVHDVLLQVVQQRPI